LQLLKVKKCKNLIGKEAFAFISATLETYKHTKHTNKQTYIHTHKHIIIFECVCVCVCRCVGVGMGGCVCVIYIHIHIHVHGICIGRRIRWR
jgi:hypothetical protein